jgi:hypothetical protein
MAPALVSSCDSDLLSGEHSDPSTHTEDIQ